VADIQKMSEELVRSQINHNFNFHPATTEEKRNEHGSIREECRGLANFIVSKVDPSRERSLALTKLEEVMFWANAGIARNQ
jgi:hypothetical protein